MDIITACVNNFIRELRRARLSGNEYASLQRANNRINLVVTFALWLLQLVSPEEKPEFVSKIFSFEEPRSFSLPDPSLALTSSLGNVFLPFLAQSHNLSSDDQESLTANGILCLFFAAILIIHSDLISTLEDRSDKMVELLYFLFIHSTLAKDKLSLSTANSLWTSDSAVGESEFLQFQGQCMEILEKVNVSHTEFILDFFHDPPTFFRHS
jgi:hypothetical protein